MSWTGDLLTGLATYLAAGGVGTWSAAGAYPANTDGAIFLQDVPGSPDRLIVLSDYLVDDDPSLSDSVTGLQVRTRGLPSSPASVDDLEAAVFDRLHGAHGLTLSTGVRINSIVRRSGTRLGVDGNRRHERSSNYLVTAHRPSQHRT